MASFKRRWKVSVGSLSTDSLAIQFKITKTLEKEPNSCELKIINLSEASRAKLTGANLPVVIEAGYDSASAPNASIIFSGDARTIDHLRNHADWITHVQCGDGEQVYQHARAVSSFAEGAQVVQAIRFAAQQLKVNRGNLDDALNAHPPKFARFHHGYVAWGRASDVLAQLLGICGLTYSIQQGALQVVKPGEPAEQFVYRLTPETGLIGSPDHTPPDKKKKPATVKCRSLLNPRIRPGSIIQIESAGVKGDFVIQKLDHVGDSHGQDWLTVIEAIAKK